MIDTVVLTLNALDVVIQEPNRFSPSADVVISASAKALGGRGNMSAYQNPTKTDLLQGNYKPRLTLNKRIRTGGGFSITLKIEFSAPKLLFGNNFDELEDTDFEKIIDKLYEKLLEMGVLVRRELLRNAKVSAIHFSKNIILPEFITSSMMIRELFRIDLNRHLDLSHTDYRNEGHALRFHANSFEVTFYDKVKDLEKAQYSEKRAIEKDSAIQMNFFENFSHRPEVLRMEVRLGNRTKLKSMLQKVELVSEMRFQDLFNQSLSQKILLHFWEKISGRISLLGMSSLKPEDLCLALQSASKGKMKPAKILQVLGSKILIDSVGIRGMRSLFDSSLDRTWQRMKKELEKFTFLSDQKINQMVNITFLLEKFEPLRIQLISKRA